MSCTMCTSTSTKSRCISTLLVLLLLGFFSQNAFAWVFDTDPFVEVSGVNYQVGGVNDLLQDEVGFIWMATDRGLLRYDGNDLVQALDIDPDAVWLDRVNIHDLSLDSKGRIWILFFNGIGYWDSEAQSFHQVSHIANKESTVILEQGKDQYWIGTKDGLYFYDASVAIDRSLERLVFVNENQDGRNRNFITSLYLDTNDRLWVGTSEGLCILDTQTRQIQEVFAPDAPLATPFVSFIEKDASGGMWIGTRENGLIYVELLSEEEGVSTPTIDYFTNVPSPHLLSVEKKDNGQLYIGTASKGYFVWDPLLQQHPDSLSNQPNAIAKTFFSGARVQSLFLDRTGLLWVGTANGVYKSTRRPVFSSTNSLSQHLQALNIKHVKSLVKDANGHYWIGAFGEGVVRVDEQKGEITHYKNVPDKANSLVDDRVLALDVDKDLNVWILTSGGISRFDLKSDSFSSYLESDDVSIVDEKVIFQDIFVSDANDVWVATSFDGILKYDVDNDRFESRELPLKVSNEESLLEIRQVIEDNEGGLWFAAGKGGLLKYDSESQFIEEIVYTNEVDEAVLAGKEVVSLTQSLNGDLWVGTLQSGAFRVNPKTGGIVQYSRKQGLPGNEVRCILEDQKGYVWIATRDGLARYNPDSDALLKYDEHDGLISTQFYYNSCILSEGSLFLGNNLGVEVLNIAALDDLESRPSVQLSSIRVLNTPLHLNDQRQPIQLERDHNHIRFQFFLPDYLDLGENQLMYKLTGVNDEWVAAEEKNVVTFTDLPPGTHQLFVKGANHRGVWSEPSIYSIQVSSIRWFFYGGIGLTGLIFMGGIGVLLSYRKKYRTRIKELEGEKLALQDESQQSVERTKAEIARDLHDDLGADLSRLVLSIENRLQRDDLSDFSLSWTKELWEYAQRVTREVRFLSWSVDPDRNWLPDLVDRIYREAHDSFDVDKIQFLTSKIPHIHLVPSIRKDIFLIVREAMTNIISHAEAEKIRIQVNYKKKMLEIAIEDDGVGFDVDQVLEGNGLSNMRKRASNLNANLFWETTQGHGTRVVFQFLIE
ncbi:MAG: ATP-binding protein [Rhodothermaceae bacterium]|nr:ATP-binding protein [Rhodothermaceae bacterium]